MHRSVLSHRSGPGWLRRDRRWEPARRWWTPGRFSLVRLLLAAILLATAAGVLSLGAPSPRPPDPAGEALPDSSPGRPGAVRTSAGPPPPGRTGAKLPADAADSRLPVPPGLVGVLVYLRDPTVTAALRPGDRVDLVVIDSTGESSLAADAALVLAVDQPVGGLLVAVPPPEGRAILTAPVGTRYLVLLRPDLSPSAADDPPTAGGHPAAPRTRPRPGRASARRPGSPAGRRRAKRPSSPTSLLGSPSPPAAYCPAARLSSTPARIAPPKPRPSPRTG
ncbi:MAG TPA: hypothetical protein VKZ67_08235 [Natronosporangium sp.]|nr:hypothetical protein [Natronosporangium sp.]